MKNRLFITLFTVAMAAPALAQETATTQGAPAAAEAPAPALTAAVVPAEREMLVSVDGRRIGRVDRLAADGAPRVIFLGRMVTVPLATLSRSEEGLVTSLTRREVMALD